MLFTILLTHLEVDRSSLGNAKTNTLEKDLHMKGNQYAITIVIFYITFCTLDLPSNLLLKKFSARYWLPFLDGRLGVYDYASVRCV
jgi:hypothetical protein